MILVILYVISLGMVFTIFVCTIPYKKTFRKKLDKKQHKLKILYGMSMFITDRLPKKLIYRNTATNKLIRELKVKEDIRQEKYLYVVEKMSVSVVALIICLIMGLLININETVKKEVNSLQRDTSEIKTYEFVVENQEGQKEKVSIDLSEKQLEEEKVFKLFDSKKEELIKTMLKDNKSTDKVDSSLDLVSSIGEENILISWDISDSSIIDYDGKISEKVLKEGEIVNVTATMILNDVSKDYTFSLKVFPAKDAQNLQNQIQSYVNENDTYKDEVQLPLEINGQKVKYFYETDTIGIWILPVGVAVAIMIFFFKDKELKKKAEERNAQMMRDYSQIVSKTLLYYNAGLSIVSIFERIIKDYKAEKSENIKVFRYAYEELELMLIKIKSGVSEAVALNEFGVRCGLHCYLKFSSILEQNLKRGGKDLQHALKAEVNSAVLEKRNLALKTGNYISTKLLGPMVIMLIVSMAIIMIPALLSINL